MPTLASPIKLGEKYRDSRSTINGHAVSLYFNHHGCVEVGLEFEKDGKLEIVMLNEQRLLGSGEVRDAGPYEYETDIVLGRKYRDVETELEGHAAVICFYEHQTERTELKAVTTNADGSDKLTYYLIDSFLLEDVETKVVAKKNDDKRSPATRESTRRR